MRGLEDASESRYFSGKRGGRGLGAILAWMLATGVVLPIAIGCSTKMTKPAGDASMKQASLEEAGKAADAFEAMESSGKGFFAALPGMRGEKENQAVDRVEKAVGEVDAYLRGNLGDPRALLLKARLLRALDAATLRRFSPGQPAPSGTEGERRLGEIRKLLEEVLERNPDIAAAHYWMARISALREPVMKDGEFSYEGGDIDKVMLHARKAVELAPAELRYREYLAQAFLATGRTDEVVELMKDVSGGNHPIYRLMSDWSLIPIPEGAALDAMMTMSMIQMAQADRAFGEYPNLRIASFTAPMSASEVFAFFRSRWSDLKQEQDEGARSHAISLAWKGNELVPVESYSVDEDSFSGVRIMVNEMGDTSPEQRKALRIPEGKAACSIMVINARKFQAR